MPQPQNSIRNLLPSLPLFLFYLLVAAVSLLIATSGSWFDQLLGPAADIGLVEQIQQRAQDLLELIQNPTSSGLSATLTTLAFWLVMGAVIYMLLWLAYAIMHAVLNEIELSLIFIHPRSFKESKHWVAFVSRIVLRVAAVLVVIGYGVLFVSVVWPAVVVQFGYGVLSPTPLAILTHMLGSVVTLIVAIHFLFLLLRVVIWKKA